MAGNGKRLRVLILGGTSEARRLAEVVARFAGIDAVLSYAGRTENPAPPPIPYRVGGFGGRDGLVAYQRAERIDRVVDATHPFAAQMSRNAVAACAATGTPLLALERAPWRPVDGDLWIDVDTLDEAADALGLSYWKKTAFSILPQALRLVIPPLVNTFIGIFDLLTAGKTAIIEPQWQGFGVEVYVVLGIIYFIFCFAMSKYGAELEAEFNRHRRR